MSQLQVTTITTVNNTTPLILQTGNTGGGQIILQASNNDVQFVGPLRFTANVVGDGSGFTIPSSNVANAAFGIANSAFTFANGVSTNTTAAFAKANAALANASGTFAGNLSVTGNVAFTSNNVTISNNAISPFAMKNRVINGNFEFWQRGTTVTLVPNTLRWLADRWTSAGFQQARHQRVSVTSPPTGLSSRFALRASSSTTAEVSTGTRIATRQKIESVNCYDLAGKNVTLSFWIRFSSATFSSVTNTGQSSYGDFFYTVMFNTTTTDSETGSDVSGDSQVFTPITNGSLPTTWTKYTVTVAVPAGCNNISVNFQFGALGSTSSADSQYYDVTEVQLEEGSIATPFERRSFGMELALCQRYYEKSYDLNISPGAATSTGRASTPTNGYTSAIYVEAYVKYKVTKRTQPTIRYWDVTGNLNRVTDLTGGGLSPTHGRNSVWGINSGDTGFGFINTQNSLTFSQFQWEASADF